MRGLLILAGVLSLGFALAAASLELSDKTVRVGYSQIPPYSSTSTTGVAEGFSIDALRLLLEPQGYTLNFSPYRNPSELLAAMENGEIELTSFLADSPARRAYGNFSSTVANIEIGVLTAAGREPPTSLEQLSGKRIGAVRGAAAYPLIEVIEGVIPAPFDSTGDMILPLLSGQIDAIAAPTASTLHIARAAEVSHRLSVTDIVLRETPVSVLVAGDEDALLTNLNSAIDAAQLTGDLEALEKEWFAPRAAPVSLREQYVIAAAIAVVLGALIYWARLHYIVLRRARRSEARSNLLTETLDATGVSLAIFDEEERAMFCNRPFEESYPQLAPLANRNATLSEFFDEWAEQTRSTTGKPDIEQSIADQIRREMFGASNEVETLDRLPSGKVMRRVTTKLPSGHIATISANVTELADAQRGLEGARKALEDANHRLIEFNRIAAHDLVAPLRNLRSLHSWIRSDIEGADFTIDAETQENFEMIDRLLERQAEMVRDLLAYSQTHSTAALEDFDPNERLRAIEDLSAVPSSFQVIWPENMPILHASPVGFDIVLRNLISNAVKHHDLSAGLISVRAHTELDTCIIRVSDDGPGIPDALIERVFEPFRRLRSRDDGGGSGLGLAIVRQRVEQWGGSVSVLAGGESRGTTVQFSIPLAKTVEQPLKIVAN